MRVANNSSGVAHADAAADDQLGPDKVVRAEWRMTVYDVRAREIDHALMEDLARHHRH
jgi:hypothetical protein